LEQNYGREEGGLLEILPAGILVQHVVPEKMKKRVTEKSVTL
jgi:hypothetical protein